MFLSSIMLLIIYIFITISFISSLKMSLCFVLIEVVYTKLSRPEPNNLKLEIKHNHQKPILIALKQSKSDFISRNLTIEHRSNGSSRFQRANVAPCFYNGYLGHRLLASLSICDGLVYNIIRFQL